MKIRKKLWTLLVTALLSMAIFVGTVSAQGPDTPQRQAINVIAELLNMTPDELKAEIKDGNRLIEIAEARGIDRADVAEAIYGLGVERVETTLANGKLTQDQADRMLARMAEGRDACATDGHCNFRRMRRHVRQFRRQIRRLNPVAETLGMTTADLIESLRSGQTIESIAAEQGMSMADLATELQDQAAERIEMAVSEGKLTRTQADRLLKRLTVRRDMCAIHGHCQPPWRR